MAFELPKLPYTNNALEPFIQSSNAANPMRNGLTPLMTCDVWEHAYLFRQAKCTSKIHGRLLESIGLESDFRTFFR